MALPVVKIAKTPIGKYLVFDTDFGVSMALRKAGTYERALLDIALKLHAAHQGPALLIDVGAHIGTFSIPVATATGCRIHAFEAQRIISQLLGGNFIFNGIDGARIENVLLAGPDSGSEALVPCVDYASPGNFGAYTPDAALASGHVERKLVLTGAVERIRVSTLDAFHLGDVFLIKIDVEGAELDVLKGATNTLERNAYPPLIFESWDRPQWQERAQALAGFLAGLGYEVMKLGDANHLAQHCSRPRVVG